MCGSVVVVKIYYATKDCGGQYLGVRVSDRKKSGVAPTTFFPITFCSMLVLVIFTSYNTATDTRRQENSQ